MVLLRHILLLIFASDKSVHRFGGIFLAPPRTSVMCARMRVCVRMCACACVCVCFATDN